MVHRLMRQLLRWLGHLARLEPSRMPKKLLFGELEKRRPCYSTKRRWRDVEEAELRR